MCLHDFKQKSKIKKHFYLNNFLVQKSFGPKPTGKVMLQWNCHGLRTMKKDVKKENHFFKKKDIKCTIHNYNKLGYSSDKFYSESKTTVDL